MIAMMFILACGEKVTDTAGTDTGLVEEAEEETTGDTGSVESSDTDGQDSSDISNTSDTSDSSDTSETGESVETYGCQIPEWGICLEGFVSEGWIYEVATDACAEFGLDNNVTTSLTSGCGMSPDNVVGACILPDTFTDFTVTGWYFTSHWTQAEAEAHCAEQNGLFIT
jgi:hypothetical protein